MKDLFAEERGAALSSTEKSLMSSVLFAGTVCGQIAFGLSADILGRKVVCISTSSIMFVSALCASMSFNWEGVWGSFHMLVSCLFFLGLAIGGEYPLSASMASESADPEKSARRTSVVYSMMGVGQVISPLVTFILLSAGLAPGWAWRTTLLIGLIPVTITFFVRYGMQDSARFRAVAAQRTAGSVGATFRKYIFTLLGTGGSWLLYDIVTYGMGSFYGELSTKMGFGETVLDEARSTLFLQILCLPGWALCIFLLDWVGRKPTQLWGFLGMAVANGALWGYLLYFDDPESASSLWIKGSLLVVGRTLDGAFVGLSTYVIPGEFFPTAVRATFHGISAGLGKLGAVIGSGVFPLLIGSGEHLAFLFASAVCALGIIWTFVLVPNYNVNLLKERLREEQEEAQGNARQRLVRDSVSELEDGSHIRSEMLSFQSLSSPSRSHAGGDAEKGTGGKAQKDGKGHLPDIEEDATTLVSGSSRRDIAQRGISSGS
uniref:Major facilitator superfamily (MFS) profile domain-containing protein n=1 Tax=Chromera velia CCMP2878 TaxID=1169474 RepID=A0A0G4I5C7_9ALVE|eukprot:Cvel_11067.t1-p1 / transcript=Cvel_11067.t1 / gene=Cvel_11067 / organism=Chromera_velia_CCMP2878 / gene_product=Putative inorganic phosphate transporter 1-13, putative / transcript_product=Putative inorganic phosphate transporter 1-13, putative / location=Cvel_scaffold683:26380-29992(+) / protein_length=488 / sequence_SO=supercontig / SO=protein_coding / is_pseudo=false